MESGRHVNKNQNRKTMKTFNKREMGRGMKSAEACLR